jgi:hypothetical protein
VGGGKVGKEREDQLIGGTALKVRVLYLSTAVAPSVFIFPTSPTFPFVFT